MKSDTLVGFITLLAGITFIIAPLRYSDFKIMILGLSLLAFGVLTIIDCRNNIKTSGFSYISMIFGGIFIIAALLIIFQTSFLQIISEFGFYILGVILIILAINGFISNINKINDLYSIILMMMGILSIFIVINGLNNILYITMIMGLILIADGIKLLISN